MIWLDPLSPPARSAVVSGGWGKEPHSEHYLPPPSDDEIDVIAVALEVASSILTPLTGFRIHPAGFAEEDFLGTPRLRRLTPSLGPLRAVVSLDWVLDGGVTGEVTVPWVLHGDTIRLKSYQGLEPWDRDTFPVTAVVCSSRGDGEQIRLSYQFGSTITASARRAVLMLAHQFWLETAQCSTCGECELPTRTTTVTREGISYTMLDPQDYLDRGKTGLPSVDLWIATVNPRRALRAPGVWSPDAPPPAMRSIRSARPLFEVSP
jgi:hypothetical protein